MQKTVRLAKMHGVKVGAHPGLPDIQGFGRREMKLSPKEIFNTVNYQVGALESFLKANAMKLNHIKPHGKLYGITCRDEGACNALLDVVEVFGVPLLGMPGTLHETLSTKRGIPFIAEFFSDLQYDASGKLIITRTHEAIDPVKAAARVKKAIEKGKVTSKDGSKELDVSVSSVCIHSDTPMVKEIAKMVRKTIDEINDTRIRSIENVPTILIANRGEIACRIIRSCKRLGYRSIAIFTPKDKNSNHVFEATEAIELPDGTNYMTVSEIIRICKENNVTAVHPGYGFLSENMEFSKVLMENKIGFVGPTDENIESFGLKHKARKLAEEAGVPVIPGSNILTSADEAVENAQKLTYPVLIKATGGGGGIGMKICQNDEEVRNAFVDCSRTAKVYFGNGEVFVEKYYPLSRHIEVQVFGDGEGNVVHFGERECSIQRRNQKVVEETPSPFLKDRDDLRKRMCDAAVKLAKLVKYRSAGTVEFLVVDEGEKSEATGKFFFLEMNTRIQVEHGITELTRSIDLVSMMIQLCVNKDSFKLPKLLPEREGHAIEVRAYAEKPSSNYAPSPGLLTEVSWPEEPWIRIDTFVSTGTDIPSDYDPLIAKIMVFGEDRDDAISKMEDALKRSKVHGPPTNMEFLSHVIRNEKFKSGNTTTRFLKNFTYAPNAIDILDGGISTSIQDYPGRINLRVFGIQPSGPMDDLAFQVANLMIGNKSGTSGLEMTIQGATIKFHRSRNVAMCGADFPIAVKQEGKPDVSHQMWNRFVVPAGAILKVGRALKLGSRCYLAIEGGLHVPDFLGSKSTGGGYGGYQGRGLRVGDQVPFSLDLDKVSPLPAFCLPNHLIPKYPSDWEAFVLPGPHGDPHYTTKEDAAMFFKTQWKVHFNSNRGGVRLLGDKPKWARVDGGKGGSHPSNIHDCGYALGSINFTGDMPIILTTDGPTQGGFACPWTIISSDLWKIGQVQPGNTIRFLPISFEESLAHNIAKSEYLRHIKIVSRNYPMTVPRKEFKSILESCECKTNPVDEKVYLGKSVVSVLEADKATNRPAIQYRQAGDQYILLEYGPAEVPLDLKFAARIHALQEKLGLFVNIEKRQASPTIEGMLDAAPAVRSLLIRYDPHVLPQSTLIQHLKKMETELPSYEDLNIVSREIHMPIALDDRWTNAAIKMYQEQVRSKASYLPSNFEFIAKNNGLEGKEGAKKALVASPWLIIGVGFYVGCPFAVPVDPRYRLNVPKYNPARTFTPSGACGIGGSYMAIYPMESPGGYQLYGRTIPTWNTFGTKKPFRPCQPWLLNLFDQLVFEPVSEKELMRIRKLAIGGKWEYDIRETVFSLKKQVEFEESVKEEVIQMRERQEKAMREQMKIETEFLKEFKLGSMPKTVAKEEFDESCLKDGEELAKSVLSGSVLSLKVKEGDTVAEGDGLISVEAMKMEMKIQSSYSGKVVKMIVKVGQQISAGDPLCVILTK